MGSLAAAGAQQFVLHVFVGFSGVNKFLPGVVKNLYFFAFMVLMVSMAACQSVGAGSNPAGRSYFALFLLMATCQISLLIVLYYICSYLVCCYYFFVLF